jgi:hypothetical protein
VFYFKFPVSRLYRVFKRVTSFRAVQYSLKWGKKRASPHTSRNQWLLRYGRVFEKFDYRDECKKIPESLCGELQLLKVSVSLLTGEFSVNNSFTPVASPHSSWPSCKGGFCQRLLGNCHVNTQSEVNILFTDDTRFTRDGIVNLHSTRVWAGDIPLMKTSTSLFLILGHHPLKTLSCLID